MRGFLLNMAGLVLMASACGSGNDGSPAAHTSTRDAGALGPDAGSARDVACVEQSIEQLDLFDQPTKGEIREEDKQGATFHTFIDASGGGLQPSESYVYGRFDEDGLSRVEISDQDAFNSLEWDIAFRRFVIRLNSGVSGPGTITGARTKPQTTFDSLEQVPDGLDYRTEQYFSADCDYINDGSGIGSPATALASFWSYSACVAMTGNVYVVALRGDKHVKLQVLDYYTPPNQLTCNQTGMVPSPNGAGNVRIEWAFLD
jgi:hypothetical protein